LHALDALFGNAMEIEQYLTAEMPGWLARAGLLNRNPAQA